MTLDEALIEAVSGARMTAAHMNGKYIEHSFARGFLRCWPVDKPEDEPNRSQCDFNPNADDRAADWFEIEAPKLAVDHSPVDSWGRATPAAILSEANAGYANAIPKLSEAAQKKWAEGDWSNSTPADEANATAEAFAALVAKPKPAAPGVWGNPHKIVSASATIATAPDATVKDWNAPAVPARDGWGVPRV